MLQISESVCYLFFRNKFFIVYYETVLLLKKKSLLCPLQISEKDCFISFAEYRRIID